MGYIENRPDRARRWRARYRAPDGRIRSKSFPRKADAQRWLRAREREMDRGDWHDPDLAQVTVAEWSERYLATRRRLKPKTRHGYESLLRVHILPTFGTVPLGRLDPMAIREWVADLSARLSASRTRQAYHLLSAMLKSAVEAGYLARNPAEGAELPRLPTTEMRFLDASQVEELVAATRPPDGTLVYVLAYCGLRWGEACALRRGRLDLLRGRLEVAESLAEVSGGLHFGEPKTYQWRSVAIPPFLRELLAVHLVQHVPDDPEALVFTSPRGRPLRRPNFGRSIWKPAVKAAGLPDDLTPHALRHTSASLLIAQGAHPVEVQAHLGHSSIQVTMDRYGHLFPSAFEATAERLEAARRSAGAPQARPKAAGEVIPLRPESQAGQGNSPS